MKPKTVCILAACLTLIGLLMQGCAHETVVTSSQDFTTNSDGTIATNTVETTNVVSTLDTNRVANLCKQAAQDATIFLLGPTQHPEWLPQFQQAEADLKIIAASSNPSLNDLLTIVERLPVKQLQGSTAQLSFEAGTLALSAVDIPPMDPTAAADVRTIAQAIADGVAAGLPAPAATPAAAN